MEEAEKFLHLQISIHAPHAGSGLNFITTNATIAAFQSTLPMRGAAVHKSP